MTGGHASLRTNFIPLAALAVAVSTLPAALAPAAAQASSLRSGGHAPVSLRPSSSEEIPQLVDITSATRIRFNHLAAPEKKYVVESMSGGVALIDYDRDGDVSAVSGIAPATIHEVGWGDAFFDPDNNGWPDLILVNGHVYPQVDSRPIGTSYREPKLLFRNQRDGTFRNISDRAGAALRIPQVSRGLAVGDLFNDGHLEVVIENLEGQPMILRAESSARNRWISFSLEGVRSNRLALNARVRVTAGDLVQEDEVRSGGSYLSQNDLRLHFGLATHTRIEKAEIFWPSGATEVLKDLPSDRFYTLREGQGVIATQPPNPSPKFGAQP
jgi:ASPIC and UnbV/FG-GAP-like repeat